MSIKPPAVPPPSFPEIVGYFSGIFWHFHGPNAYFPGRFRPRDGTTPVSPSHGIPSAPDSDECFGMPDTILDLDRELDRLCAMLRNTKDEKMRAKLVEAIREIIGRRGGNVARPEASTQ
ncbi:MAG TPA: hypothetical protein VH020_08015 [Stellaceae bacterium]|nr:hypothetical protein [Stellaceae bacterium]